MREGVTPHTMYILHYTTCVITPYFISCANAQGVLFHNYYMYSAWLGSGYRVTCTNVSGEEERQETCEIRKQN